MGGEGGRLEEVVLQVGLRVAVRMVWLVCLVVLVVMDVVDVVVEAAEPHALGRIAGEEPVVVVVVAGAVGRHHLAAHIA